ncbi:MAG: reverse transcriptase-like protein [Terriglobia bacterium]
MAIIDGAARGNPGPAAYGVIFKDARGKVLARLAASLGRTTNNVAEWRALLAALAYARRQGWRQLKVLTDSELLARQLTGAYRVRSADLKPLHEEAQQLVAQFSSFAVEAVRRHLTREADKLANAALDRRPVSRPYGRPSGRAPRPVTRDQRAKTTPSPVAPLSRAESRDATGRQTVRATYEGGVLKPREQLDLAEGEEVELILRRKPQR